MNASASRLQAIDEALDLPPPNRTDFVESLARDDEELASAVAALLVEADASELAASISQRGQGGSAETLLARALSIDRAAGSDHQARVLNRLGVLKAAGGDDEAALALFTQAIEYRRARFGNGHPDLPTNLINLAGVQLRREGPATAMPLLEEALAGRRRIFGDRHVNTSDARAHLAAGKLAAGDFPAAERLLLDVQGTLDPTNEGLQLLLADRFVTLYERWGRPRMAERYRRPAGRQE